MQFRTEQEMKLFLTDINSKNGYYLKVKFGFFF